MNLIEEIANCVEIYINSKLNITTVKCVANHHLLTISYKNDLLEYNYEVCMDDLERSIIVNMGMNGDEILKLHFNSTIEKIRPLIRDEKINDLLNEK